MTDTNPNQRPEPTREMILPQQDGVMTAISRAELDAQITTARAFPRSIRRFLDDAESMALLNEKVADDCYYALPSRKGDGEDNKPIEGPSIRMAEILLSAWGNARCGARVIEEGAEFITAQGVFRDLERNTEVSKEVRVRITTKSGRRYSPDMIKSASNSACSIAMRNAITAGIPRGLWDDVYEKARAASVGSEKTLVAKRTAMLAFFAKPPANVTEAQVCAALGVRGVEDIDLSKLATLKGIVNAIRDGETTIEQAFPSTKAPGAAGGEPPLGQGKGVQGLTERMKAPDGSPLAGKVVGTATTTSTPAATSTPTTERKEEIDDAMRRADVAEDNPPRKTVAKGTEVGQSEATQEATGNGKEFPLVPLDDSTAFWIADIEDVQSRKPLLGTVLYLGASFGFQQWDGSSWRTVPETEIEAYSDRCVLAMRKRLTKRWKDEGKDRAQAMTWVKTALDLKDPLISLSPLTLDQLVKVLGLMGTATEVKS